MAENLRLFARLEKVPDVEATVEEMLEQTALAERRDDQVGTLSGGNQQRINIAIGLLSRPAVLLLDEPSTGLDPRQRARLWEFVLALAGRGTTVIFSTHNIAEAERYGRAPARPRRRPARSSTAPPPSSTPPPPPRPPSAASPTSSPPSSASSPSAGTR